MSPQSNNLYQIDIPDLPSTTPAGPASPQHEKDAARAMSRTNSWKPSFLARRHSYHQEDQKHTLQMSGVQDIQECPGFSERK
ncbi:hypothetical protein F4804DRAFT_210394 [Jackrogersella minutella]|nr:hypothetical protein F4804DRAFT_210394 [Jackrogersella minutella]